MTTGHGADPEGAGGGPSLRAVLCSTQISLPLGVRQSEDRHDWSMKHGEAHGYQFGSAGAGGRGTSGGRIT